MAESIDVLIIDDSARMRDLLWFLLDDLHPYQGIISTAASVASAVNILSIQKFDVITTDLTLTDSEGIETVKRIISAADGTPVIVMSGVDDPEMLCKAISAGAVDYIVKGSLDTHGIACRILVTVLRHRRNEDGSVQC